MDANWRILAVLLGVIHYDVVLAAQIKGHPPDFPEPGPWYVERLVGNPPVEYNIAKVFDDEFPPTGFLRLPIDPAFPHFPYGWDVER